MKRRDFLTQSGLALLGAVARDTSIAAPFVSAQGIQATRPEPIIDIHQHLSYNGRPDDVFIAHQRIMGATKTILLPAGRPAIRPSTHEGTANGLQVQALGNQACLDFARAHRDVFLSGANDVPDLPDAAQEIERYLKQGAKVIAEQKFGVECDSPQMQRIYTLAGAYNVPVLMHWQLKMYNYGFERFYKMLEKFPRVTFLGHAQLWWSNIDKAYSDESGAYPKGPVIRGGLTDRYLSDYPNMYGDLSANSGLNALTRDEDFTRDFLTRHRDKLLFGSDCNDLDGGGPKCLGAQIIAAIRRLAPSHEIERKLLYDNARRVFRL